MQAYAGIGNVPEKSAVNLDWIPESGTRIPLNGAQNGAEITGGDFYRALLPIRFGDKPVQDDLKEHLPGKAP